MKIAHIIVWKIFTMNSFFFNFRAFILFTLSAIIQKLDCSIHLTITDDSLQIDEVPESQGFNNKSKLPNNQ